MGEVAEAAAQRRRARGFIIGSGHDTSPEKRGTLPSLSISSNSRSFAHKALLAANEC